jgi:UDP:flavonoid glycosyltransferase YjiC (YdhE family)
MRMLFGFAGGIGHVLPIASIAPIARAAQAAGHTVAVAGRPQHAAEVEALGVGRSLNALEATPTDIREAAAVVLGDASYRSAAEGIAVEVAGLPGPEHAVALLERL